MKFLITESQYSLLIYSQLNESQEYLYKPKAGCETYTPGKGCDPYQYLKVVDGSKTNYYFKLEKDENWKLAKNISGIESIENNVIFQDTPSETPILSQNKPTVGNSNTTTGEKKRTSTNTTTGEKKGTSTNTTTDEKKWSNFPCVPAFQNAKISKMTDGSTSYTIPSWDGALRKTVDYIYYNNGKLKKSDGTMMSYYCRGNTIILGNKISSGKSTSSKTCVVGGSTISSEKIKSKDKSKPNINWKTLFDGKYKKEGKRYPEIDKIINAWVPTYDTSYLCKTGRDGKAITDQDYKSWDWDINVNEYERAWEKYVNDAFEKAITNGYDVSKFRDSALYLRDEGTRKIENELRSKYNQTPKEFQEPNYSSY